SQAPPQTQRWQRPPVRGSTPPEPPDTATDDAKSWSPATNGLQARLTLVEKSKINGTRWIVPYLELRNVRTLANPMEVNCQHVKIDLVDADGRIIREGWLLPRSGPTPQLGRIVLPWDSSIRMSLECRNWGVPKNAAAMVATDSGAWVVQENERGKICLRATMTNKDAPRDSTREWRGKLETP